MCFGLCQSLEETEGWSCRMRALQSLESRKEPRFPSAFPTPHIIKGKFTSSSTARLKAASPLEKGHLWVSVCLKTLFIPFPREEMCWGGMHAQAGAVPSSLLPPHPPYLPGRRAQAGECVCHPRPEHLCFWQ